MSTGKRTLVIVGAKDEESALRKQIGELAEVVGVESDPNRGLAMVEEHRANIALLFLDHDPPRILDLARQATTVQGCVPIVVSRNKNPDSILVAMRAGARDFAYLDDTSNDVRRAILDLGVTLAESAGGGGGRRGKIITVFSAKGGSGATIVASNLAGALRKQAVNGEESRVVLLDFNLEMGDVLVFLDMASRYSFHDLLTNMHRLDADLLYGSLAAHSSGLRVVSQTDHIEEGRDLSADDAARILAFLRQHFDFIVIDGVRDFRELALLALDKADTILLVMTQDIPALKNANRCLRIFKRLGYTDDRVKLVLNRYRRVGQLTPDSIGDALGRKVSITIANDFPEVIRSVNEGKLLVDAAPSSSVAKDIVDLASMIHAPAAPKKKGLFALWGRG